MGTKNIYTLYFVLDPDQCQNQDPLSVAHGACKGGITCLQLRYKQAHETDILSLARALQPLLSQYNIPLIINDYPELAAKIAAGVHVGQEDESVEKARTIVGNKAIVGVSVGSRSEEVKTKLSAVDYVGIGPIFPTTSKSDAGRALGLSGLQELSAGIKQQHPQLPIVAIGGITARTAPDVIKAGAEGIAVISAISHAANPQQAAASLRQAITINGLEEDKPCALL